MPLIACAECNVQVSDRANSCPNCGCPLAPVTQPVLAPMHTAADAESVSSAVSGPSQSIVDELSSASTKRSADSPSQSAHANNPVDVGMSVEGFERSHSSSLRKDRPRVSVSAKSILWISAILILAVLGYSLPGRLASGGGGDENSRAAGLSINNDRFAFTSEASPYSSLKKVPLVFRLGKSIGIQGQIKSDVHEANGGYLILNGDQAAVCLPTYSANLQNLEVVRANSTWAPFSQRAKTLC